MESKYANWIRDNVDASDCRNTCETKTREMVEAFPELQRVRGHYIDVIDGSRPHWWCKTEEGVIVDPTASQFNPYGDYEEIDESLGELTGRCPNCSDGLCYDGAGVCSKKCHDEYVAYLNRSM